MPIAHPSCNKASEKGGEIAGQQLNFNRRLIDVEEENKEQPDDQAVNLNHNDSWNGKIIIKHAINDEDSTPAAGHHKDFS